MTELLLERRDGPIVTLTLHRPDVMNALNFPTLLELRAACARLREDETVRAVIFTGAGERAFSAGADLKERKTMPREKVPEFVANIRGAFDDVAALPMPTIAAVNGIAFGGGMELALACDLRVLATHATLGLTEVTLAIIPGAGGTQRLPRLVGLGLAKELILTGDRISPERALAIGLANRVVPPDQVLPTARELAERLAANGPVAVRAAKSAIDRGIDHPLEQGLAIEAECYERVLPTEDRLEALAAFAEKRKPVYRGC